MGHGRRRTYQDANGQIWDCLEWCFKSSVAEAINQRRHTGVPPQHELDAIVKEFERKKSIYGDWKSEGF